MKATEAIIRLRELVEKHGDLEVCLFGEGEMDDYTGDQPLARIEILEGAEVRGRTLDKYFQLFPWDQDDTDEDALRRARHIARS